MSSPNADEPRYPQLRVDVPAHSSDDVSATLFELGALGLEERDETTLESAKGPGWVTLVASFPDPALAEAAARELDPTLAPRVTEWVGDAWRDEWKKHFVPFRLSPRVVIRPPWEPHVAENATDIVLELEPGRAFGTGLHATTALVARALEDRASRLAGAHVLDVGTGSGILALVAIALGAARARAIDVDPEAASVTEENARRNGLSGVIEADTAPLESVRGTYDVVLANIEARVLVPMAAALVSRVRPGGMLILSGVLSEQEPAIREAYRSLELSAAPTQDEWVALIFEARGERIALGTGEDSGTPLL